MAFQFLDEEAEKLLLSLLKKNRLMVKILVVLLLNT